MRFRLKSPSPPFSKALPDFQWVKSADRSVLENCSNRTAAGTVARPTLSSAVRRRVGHRADRTRGPAATKAADPTILPTENPEAPFSKWEAGGSSICNSSCGACLRQRLQCSKKDSSCQVRPGDHSRAFPYGFALPHTQSSSADCMRTPAPSFAIFLIRSALRIRETIRRISNACLPTGRPPKKN